MRWSVRGPAGNCTLPDRSNQSLGADEAERRSLAFFAAARRPAARMRAASDRHRAGLVLRLAALSWHSTVMPVGRCDAHRGVGLLHVLAARARGAEDVDPENGGVQHHVAHFVHFREHRHRAGGGVDAAPGIR